MRTIVITGSDTGIGKTHVAGLIAAVLGRRGRVQIVKPVETGTPEVGDAERARRAAGNGAAAFTLASFPLPLAPAAAAAAAGQRLAMPELVERVRALPDCDWRLCEGAGGIASPIDDEGRDWADFAAEIGADAVVIVVADRLGAINQGRLAHGRAVEAGLKAGVWLNAIGPADAAVADSNREGLRAAGVPLWGEVSFDGAGEALPPDPPPANGNDDPVRARCVAELGEREARKLRRRLRVAALEKGELNLADNDYLDLARDPAVVAAGRDALVRWGTSASASPLVTGWRPAHNRLVEQLAGWHGFSCGLLWSSGFAANAAVMGTLPRKGDLVLADRLDHHSLLAGIIRSGARLQRYRHLDLDQLEAGLKGADARSAGRGERTAVFVATESVFSMDGDYPDLARLAELKRRHGFFWVLDEAHALGWYGPEGAGLARAAGVEGAVDILVGTLGKTLASGGAYTLFHDPAVRDALVNLAGEFIYSTAIPPAAAAAAGAAVERVRALAGEQPRWHASSREFRRRLRAQGWSVPDGDSPIVPLRLDDEDAALALADRLGREGIRAVAIRPPTVPAGTSRLRLSLKRTFGQNEADRVLAALGPAGGGVS